MYAGGKSPSEPAHAGALKSLNRREQNKISLATSTHSTLVKKPAEKAGNPTSDRRAENQQIDKRAYII